MDIIDFLFIDTMSDNIVLAIIFQSFAFAIGLAKIYTDMQVKLKDLDARLSAVEKQDDVIYDKLDMIQGDLLEIKLELKDKADRP